MRSTDPGGYAKRRTSGHRGASSMAAAGAACGSGVSSVCVCATLLQAGATSGLSTRGPVVLLKCYGSRWAAPLSNSHHWAAMWAGAWKIWAGVWYCTKVREGSALERTGTASSCESCGGMDWSKRDSYCGTLDIFE